MKIINLLSLFSLLFLFQNNLIGQCTSIDQLFANSGTGTAVNSTTTVGQSFISCKDGKIDKITVRVDVMGATPINSVLKIADGLNTSTNVIHTQNIVINGMGDLEIDLTTPVALVNGNTYSFSLGGAGDALTIGFSSALGDVYPDGTLFQNTTPLTTADLFFKISYQVLAPIPTLSQWGLLIVALLVLNLGSFMIRREELNTLFVK